MDCEVCKNPLPKSITINGVENALVEIERPPCPYIILEYVHRE